MTDSTACHFAASVELPATLSSKSETREARTAWAVLSFLAANPEQDVTIEDGEGDTTTAWYDPSEDMVTHEYVEPEPEPSRRDMMLYRATGFMD